jgi:hypothetical protein
MIRRWSGAEAPHTCHNCGHSLAPVGDSLWCSGCFSVHGRPVARVDWALVAPRLIAVGLAWLALVALVAAAVRRWVL